VVTALLAVLAPLTVWLYTTDWAMIMMQRIIAGGETAEQTMRIMWSPTSTTMVGVSRRHRNLGEAWRARHDVALVVPSPGWRGRLATAEQVSVTYRGHCAAMVRRHAARCLPASRRAS